MALDVRFWIDAGVLGAYFVLIVGIGLRMGQRDKTMEGFALGGRSMPWWAVLASIVAAETSAGTFIGTPGEGYQHLDYTYLQLAIGTILARIIVAFVFIKPYYDNRVTSIYEYLSIRFGSGTKNAASAVFLVTRVLASGARLYVAAIVLVVAVELLGGIRPTPIEEFWIYFAATTVMTLLTTLYTTLGGIKAVIWTDVIQAALMLGSACLAIALLLWSIPGHWGGVTATLGDIHRIPVFATGTIPGAGLWTNIKAILGSEYTIGAALIGSTFTTMATHGTDQDMVQRMLTAPDIKRSRRSLIMSGLADIPIVFLFLSIGILLHVFYQLRPDPALPSKTNEIFVYYILREMPVGLRGLLVAGIFATAMGSLSTALNALATSFTQDWVVPRRPGASQASIVRTARIFTLVFGALMILVASVTAYIVILTNVRIIPIVLGIFGYTYGSLLGVFLVGLLTKNRGHDRGNLIAMAGGFVAVAILSGLPNDVLSLFHRTPLTYPDWLPLIEFPWRIFFGTTVTFLIAILFRRESKLSSPRPS
jgi:solute:Na+ symporter, SSS family